MKKKIKSLSIGIQVIILLGSIMLSLGMVVQAMQNFDQLKTVSFFGAVLTIVGGNIVNFFLGRVAAPIAPPGTEFITEVESEDARS